MNKAARVNLFAGARSNLLGELQPVDLDPDNGTGSFDRGAGELPDVIFIDGFE